MSSLKDNPMLIGSNLYVSSDNNGNEVYLRIFYNERKENVCANIYLKLRGKDRPRNLGRYDYHNRTFYCQRKMSKHYHHAVKGFGFCWRVLDDPYLNIDRIHIVVDDEVHYEFPKSLIKDYGCFLNFKEQGFELQRFIRLDLIKRYSKTDEKPTE
jgi:hypothetical protein